MRVTNVLASWPGLPVMPATSAAPPVQTLGFNFNPVSDMTNCKPATFTWFYVGDLHWQPGDLIFMITSDMTGNTDLDQVITPVTVDPMARSYTWPSVFSNLFKVKQGNCDASSTSTSGTKTWASLPSASAVPNPGLNFNHTADMKNCTPAVINWFYYRTTDPQPDDLTLTIKSDIPVGDIEFEKRISPDPIDPSARSFTWPSVNQVPGVFQIAAQSDSAGWTVLSGPFNVVNNTGLCRVISTRPTSTQSETQTTTAAAIPENGTQSNSTRGAIAGGVVGGVIFIVVIGFGVIRRRFRRRPDLETIPEISPFSVSPQDGTRVLVHGDGKTTLTWNPPAVDKSLTGSGKRSHTAETPHSDSQEDENLGPAFEGGQPSQVPAGSSTEGAVPEPGPLWRAIAERVTAVELQLQTQGQLGEQPPGYDAEPAQANTVEVLPSMAAPSS
ncbi:hypothetical protein C8R46DRAFT_1186654 [Mycena filopes]|nr:hypothetical protein C8R46DRAFT_1186654 [Mycena filopes]